MAKELYSAKVEGSTKEALAGLTEKYKEEGLISENGDLLNLAADLLERNLSVQQPRQVAGIQELDQLTSRINRLFVGMIEQNNTLVETIKIEHQESSEKLKINVDSLLMEKQELKEQLTQKDNEMQELTKSTMGNQEQMEKALAELNDKNKYILLLEEQNKTKDNEIQKLKEFQEANVKLVSAGEEKDKKIEELLNQIAGLEDNSKQLEKDFADKVKEMEFDKKEALFKLEKELNEKFNEKLEEVRTQRDEFVNKFEERITSLQEKFNSVSNEKQKIETLYQALKIQSENEKAASENEKKGNK